MSKNLQSPSLHVQERKKSAANVLDIPKHQFDNLQQRRHSITKIIESDDQHQHAYKHFIFRVGQFNTSCLASEDDIIVKQGKQRKPSKQEVHNKVFAQNT